METSKPRNRALALSLLAWVVVWIFWYFATGSFHPSSQLAIVTTSSLVFVYAAAAYINQLILIPRLWQRGRTPAYLGTLLAVMIVLTAGALTVIRTTYLRMLGPDPDPNGLAKHFAIDFAGMTLHLIGAAFAVRLYHRFVNATR